MNAKFGTFNQILQGREIRNLICENIPQAYRTRFHVQTMWLNNEPVSVDLEEGELHENTHTCYCSDANARLIVAALELKFPLSNVWYENPLTAG